MWSYEPPLRDIRFVIEEVLGAPAQWAAMPAFAEIDQDMARQIAEEAGKFASEVLAPTNQTGDAEGCQFADGRVTTPKGFREAYRAFVDAGWPALPCDPAVGGQGLPHLLNAVLYEMLNSSNHAWSMYPGLLQGAYECLHAHASDDLKATYLGKIVSGEWLSTMCLTEAHAGSDLGLLRTRAEPQADGSYVLRGTKIFISGAEHDLTDNIIHLVLARLPDAPAGTKGISLFLVPKILPSSGERNAVRCDGIEKKMGIKGSATCVVSFDGAQGWIIGEPHRGLAAMFVMMNASRLHVGLQGVGHAEAAAQNALRYAGERVQMRAARRPPGHDGQAAAADPIAWHPAVRRTLLSLQARVQAARVLAYETAQLIDASSHATDEGERGKASKLVALLTPIVKSYLTEMGFQSASDALQLYGGHGYIHDYGIEQCVRDSRIAMIYEGTNEIQAIDLLVRKILPAGGQPAYALLDWIEGGLPDEGSHSAIVRELASKGRDITGRLAQAAGDDPELALVVADDYLALMALTLLARCSARADAVAQDALARAPEVDAAFYRAKRDTAAHFFAYELAEAKTLLERIEGSIGRTLPFVTEA